MNFDKIKPGKNIPEEVNVIIEIPAHSDPVKYEVDKETGALFVDRFMSTAMYYPANYGYVPQTLSLDGDPVDALVLTEIPLLPGSVIRARPIGMLKMEDEAGIDAKILMVPITKISKAYSNIQTFADIPRSTLLTIEHFFAHYKDLEEGKWVKIQGWDSPEAATKEIMESIDRYETK